MSRSFWRLRVRSEFSASHALRHYQGKCESIHGHNFSVEVEIEGEKLTEKTEYLLDFGVMKKELNALLDTLDHKDLNTTPPFDVLNPTSENLARHIFTKFCPMVEVYNVRLHSVTVGEKASQSATYFEE
jgi:queuosine biosynthesis protein QueD